MRRSTNTLELNPVYSALIAGLAFIALLLPIVTPGLEPDLVGAHAFHGHIAINGVIEPHSHELNEPDNEGLIFTSDDSGSTVSALFLMSPLFEQVSPVAELRDEMLADSRTAGQWSPSTTPDPPRLSV